MQKTMKTNGEHFEYFKRCCLLWQKELALTNWAIYFDHKEEDDRYGSCSWHMGGGVATITLSKKWDALRPLNNEELNRCALHEMLHLMFAEYCSNAEARYTSEASLEIAEHSIIRKMENLLLDRVKKGV